MDVTYWPRSVDILWKIEATGLQSNERESDCFFFNFFWRGESSRCSRFSLIHSLYQPFRFVPIRTSTFLPFLWETASFFQLSLSLAVQRQRNEHKQNTNNDTEPAAIMNLPLLSWGMFFFSSRITLSQLAKTSFHVLYCSPTFSFVISARSLLT